MLRIMRHDYPDHFNFSILFVNTLSFYAINLYVVSLITNFCSKQIQKTVNIIIIIFKEKAMNITVMCF